MITPGPGPSTPGPGCWSIVDGGSTLVWGVAIGLICASPVNGEFAGMWQPTRVAAKKSPRKPGRFRVSIASPPSLTHSKWFEKTGSFPTWAGSLRFRTLSRTGK